VLIGALTNLVGLPWAVAGAGVLTLAVFFLAPTLRVRETALRSDEDAARVGG
jgi:hypothetical protein